MKIRYNPNLKQLSRDLRNNSTYSEVLLWNEIKGRKIKGYQFMRQKPIGEYVVDFYCSKLKLVIEIDGVSHIGKELKDKMRQDEIENSGISFLRFSDDEVKTNLPGVIERLVDWIEKHEESIQSPNPLI